ncbi:MAG: AarF/ABC1/UbiB kinase family protein [Bacteroidales bacterium]|nr:AarF/ABC1/UbiB kinase family protein [Bacteroidales bacterium]
MPLKFPKNPKIFDKFNNALTVLFKYGIAPFTENGRLKKIVNKTGIKTLENSHKLNKWEKIRLATQELGATAVYFAKFLCSRPDILPLELISEFSALEFDKPQVTKATAIEIFETSTRRKADKTFSYFDNYCFFQNGYAAVFRAKMLTGEDVAVKIILPEAKENAISDIKLLKRLAGLADSFLERHGIQNPSEIIDSFSQTIMPKLDLRNEAEMIKRFKKAYRDMKSFAVPEVFSSYNSENTLVTTYYNTAGITKAKEFTAWGLDHRKVSDTFLNTFITGMLTTGLFEASLTDETVRIMPEGKIAFSDFSSTNLLTSVQRNLISDIVAALTTQNSGVLANSLRKIAFNSDFKNYQEFKNDVQLLADNLYFMESSEHYMREFSFGIMKICFKHKITLPAEILRAFSALSDAENIALSITPTCLISDFFKPYGKKLQFERFSPERFKNTINKNLSQASDFLENSPLELSVILRKIRQGQLFTNINITDFKFFVRRMDIAANKLIFCFIIGILILSATISAVFIKDGFFIFGLPVLSFIGFTLALFFGVMLLAYVLGTRFKNHKAEEYNDN